MPTAIQPSDQFRDEIRIIDIALLTLYRNAGIGSGLIEDLLAEAAATGRPVRLQVVRSNPALELYERMGFRVLREVDIEIGGGYFMRDYLMQLDIPVEGD